MVWKVADTRRSFVLPRSCAVLVTSPYKYYRRCCIRLPRICLHTFHLLLSDPRRASRGSRSFVLNNLKRLNSFANHRPVPPLPPPPETFLSNRGTVCNFPSLPSAPLVINSSVRKRYHSPTRIFILSTTHATLSEIFYGDTRSHKLFHARWNCMRYAR